MTQMMMNELKGISNRLAELRRDVERVKRRKSRLSVPRCHIILCIFIMSFSQMYPAIVMLKCMPILDQGHLWQSKVSFPGSVVTCCLSFLCVGFCILGDPEGDHVVIQDVLQLQVTIRPPLPKNWPYLYSVSSSPMMTWPRGFVANNQVALHLIRKS